MKTLKIRIIRFWYSLTSRRKLYEFNLDLRCNEAADAQGLLAAKLAQLERARYQRDDAAELRALTDIAIAQYALLHWNVALDYVHEAFAAARKIKHMDLPVAAELYNLWGCILQNHGHHGHALEYYQVAAAILSKWCYAPVSAEVSAIAKVVSQNIAGIRNG
jgi:hypothetical protein